MRFSTIHKLNCLLGSGNGMSLKEVFDGFLMVGMFTLTLLNLHNEQERRMWLSTQLLNITTGTCA